MNMKPEEITAIIKKQIEDYNVEMNVDDVGTVLEVGDGIAHIYGLEKAMSGELLELPHGVYGMALNLEEDNVGAYCSAMTPSSKKATPSVVRAALCVSLSAKI